MGFDVTEVSNSSLNAASAVQRDGISRKLTSLVEPQGFEVYPFLIGWYNGIVDPVFRLPHADDTLACVLISTPSMFEKTFIPFIREHDVDELRDPIDQCMAHVFYEISQSFSDHELDVIMDFEFHPNKRPKLLAQTAAHVAGAAFLYQYRNLSAEYCSRPKKMMGLCLHPTYGGWFAIRGCLIFKNISSPDLVQKEPLDILSLPADQINALELFNFHWRDSRFRDVVPVKEKYSTDQQLYFNTPPGLRKKILENLRAKYS